ncbi:RNA-guided endonuclease InsQ/TnpB family protein [Secundilactobacillus mixtipabuli]|uniref:Transposase n=1 Tax=Secundilactobacillus mixtipabuli TaxID=1435342 RepID=A0A1Z5I9J6_9LACO|nr:RNA-guided endonuclease TnpB family protein [Secundilactobacillus mixtipabuli]GAW98328.1 transposase [Secundilactobacillus mixtipabuli]
MLLTYKVEIKPTEKQAWQIDSHISGSRWAYNLFLDINQQRYERGYYYLNAYAFSKWFNHDYLEVNPDDLWIKDLYAKSVKQAFIDADMAMKRFFKKQSGYPHWRSFKRGQGSYYFVKNGKTQIIPCQRHRIKLPKLGWVRLKEFGYIPIDSEHFVIKQGRIKCKAGRYYLTCLVELTKLPKLELAGEPIGIDLGLKEFAILNDGTLYPNQNKSSRVRRIRKRLRRLQRKMSRQYHALEARKQKEGKSATDFNLAKNQRKVQRLYQRLTNIQSDYQNKIIATAVRTKPQWVAIEDLNVKGILKNRHLTKAVSYQGFYNFRIKLVTKCQQLGIPVHLTNRFEPTSKVCHQCGHKKVDLKLQDRVYECQSCDYTEDRDINAALNIRDTENFELAY